MLLSDLCIVAPQNRTQESLQGSVDIDPEGEVYTGIMIDLLLLFSQPVPSLLLSYLKELHYSLLELLVNYVALKLGEVEGLLIDFEGPHVGYRTEQFLELWSRPELKLLLLDELVHVLFTQPDTF